MKKLTLDIDELRVESFETIGTRHGAGTVLGHVDVATKEYTCACFSQECPTSPRAGTCGGCVYSNGAGAYCTFDDCGGPNTIGEHCGAQGTMNPVWSDCVLGTMAGATCEGGTCGQVCSYVNC